MLNYNTQTRIEALVNEFVDDWKMFTAGEIVARFRENNPNDRERYAHLRDHIHQMFFNGDMGGDYKRTSVAFPTSKGIEAAFVYHPDSVDPRKYESHETRKVPAPVAPPAPALSHFGFSAENGDELPVSLGDFHVRTTVPPVPPTFVAPVPSPINWKQAGEPEAAYTTDMLGQVVLGKDCTSKLVNSHFCSIYALAERKRVTLLGAADPLATNTTILTLDDNWSASIPLTVLMRAGLDGKPLTVTVEDDAIYLTEKK